MGLKTMDPAYCSAMNMNGERLEQKMVSSSSTAAVERVAQQTQTQTPNPRG
jgi:hypothetical protein